ncbi:hypothetical protein ABVK25_005406 [Lepraria finkii]|uniref:Transcription factor TFIIIC complex subunit Tfc6 n=1 Tax=Lepraria finkii TaxID=1340010 RepID=A0ABR4B958_9LECA
MTDGTTTRKSGRERIPNKKYTNDAFESLNIFSSDSEEEELAVLEKLQNAEDDEDFPEDQAVVEPEDEDSLVEEDLSDGSGIKTPIEEYEDAHSYASTDVEEPLSPKAARRKGHRAQRDPNVHSRGMPETPFSSEGRYTRINFFTGQGVEDISHVVKSRDQWVRDPTLPRRSKLCHSFSHTEEKRQMEANVGWDWYYDQGGREFFAKKQTFQLLNVDEAVNYVPEPTSKSHSFLMGPYGTQKFFTLAPSQSVGLDPPLPGAGRVMAWQNSERAMRRDRRRGHGWMLNAGTRVRCLDWAPNHDGGTQYLAVAIAPPKDSARKGLSKVAPAFTPSPSTPAAIQIWAFATTSAPETQSSLDSERAPELRIVIVSDWGDVSQLKWCPVPRSPRNEDVHGYTSTSIGLLAGIWGDGYARVLDVRLDENKDFQTRRYDSAAFAARSEGTLSTCLTWFSATDLAVGHANGVVAIYDIYPQPEPEQQRPSNHPPPPGTAVSSSSTNPTPKPWFTRLLHPTYILSLISAYPTHPTFLISSSSSGHVRLTSLLAPTTDYVLSPRSRTPPTSLAYHDGLLSIVGTEENSETIRGQGWGLWMWGGAMLVLRLVGRMGVVVTNPMRKVLGRREAGYQLVIFKHEWVRRPPQPGDRDAAGEGVQKRLGMSRITEGYKGERVDVDVHKKHDNGRWKGGVTNTTIHEEETAATAVAWNPNLTCGGWLAVGWGSGLLRVQDMAI